MISTVEQIHKGKRYRLKDKDKARIYKEICTTPRCSRKTIIQKLRIRPTTVSKIVRELIEDGLVEETSERFQEAPGRAQVVLRANPDRLTAVSITVQARQIRAARLNITEEVQERYAEPLPPEVSNEGFLEGCLRAYRAVTQEVLNDSEMLGVALSLVGTVDSAHKRWISTARWKNIRNLDLGKLELSLGIPLLVNRMQDAELLYFIQKNPSYREKNVLLVHWGFGIGASFASRGSLLDSTVGRTCEIGHVRVSSSSTKQCQCGAYGCLETEAALWALQGNTPLVPEGILDEDELSQHFRESEIVGDPLIGHALEHFCLALYNFIQVFYPDTVLFIGPVTENNGVFQSIAWFMQRELPTYARDRIEFLALIGGFKGCIRSSVYPFFQKRLETLLKVRSF
ncbi:MAG: ROK family transcriptional regulator [Spirochaetes bacterium]|nr:ROK family transcriptional regulator [Spirochaetota bacterium]